MHREKELVTNIIILGFGRILPRLTSLITLPILTAKLTKTEYGTYDLLTTLIMLVIPIATLQVQSAAFRFLIDCRGNNDKSSAIITNIFVVTIPISIFVSLVMQCFFSNYSVLIRLLLSIYFVLDTVYLTCSQIVRGVGKNKEYTFATTLVSIVNMLCIYFIVQIADKGFIGVMIALPLANFIGSSYLIFVSKLYNFWDFSKISLIQIRALLSYSWPMVPNNLSNWVLKLSDRLIITAFLGIEANAIYAVANKIPNLLSIGQSVMVMAWQENASITVKDEDADIYFSKMFNQIFCLLIGLTALLIGFTPMIFMLFIRGDYKDAYIQIPILILGMFFYCMSAFQGGIYIAHKKTKSVGITTTIAAGINIAIDLLLINCIGITAGSISTLVAYFLLYLFRIKDSLKFQDIDYMVKKQCILLFMIVIMLFLCFMQNLWINIFNIVFGFCYCIFLNRHLFKGIRKGKQN